MEHNEFKQLTDSMFTLYMSLKESGFDDHQAFELTKTYCSVAFVDNAIRMERERYKKSRRELIDRMNELRARNENDRIFADAIRGDKNNG